MKRWNGFTFAAAMLISFASCGQSKSKVQYQPPKKDLSKLSEATFAAGCFWCVEGVFESVKGVEEAVSGYSGGKTQNPTYEAVGSHKTGHAETVNVFYDPAVVSYPTLLKVYFTSQNPTQVNGQGPDEGTPYRSIIFYRNEQEKEQALAYKIELQKKYKEPIAAEVIPLQKFWKAEDYHQNYIQHNPNVPYVLHESLPRIRRFQKQYPDLIKPDYQY